MDWLWSFVWGSIPTWVWIVVGGVALGAVWRWFGWQGIVGGLAAVLTLGAYRQGWRDRDAGIKPVVPVEPLRMPRIENPPPLVKKRRTLMDIWQGR